MKFIERFSAARQVSTPLVAVRTPDAASTITNVRKSLAIGFKKTEADAEIAKTPLVSWDAIHGLRGVNDKGSAEVANWIGVAQIDASATTQLPIALQALENATQDVICFVHNAHLFWIDPLVIQGIWNLRDGYKANGNMLVLLTSLGTILPSELNNDVLLLEEPLPTRAEIEQIVKSMFQYANCAPPSKEVCAQAGDALIGIAAFPSEQETAMSLEKATGKLDVQAMWARKRDIIGATAGLSFYAGKETLSDAGGLANAKNYFSRVMNGKRGANLILRLDEIEKAFAGAGTDTSGVKGDLLGNFLSWVEDKKVICSLFLGVPGASKSHFIYCLGGEFKKPVLNFDIAGMQDSLVGNSGKNLRMAEATVEAISDGQILLLATANSLRGLPPELLSRFERNGIFFFDAPDEIEREEILKLKIARYKLTTAQIAEVPDMKGWTGREIDSMCNNADMLNLTLTEAGKYVIPLTSSHADEMKTLRMSAHNRYLSASHEGRYQYTEPEKLEVVHTSTVTQGRKMR